MAYSSVWNDTIVAIATAPGTGAIAVIRLSGGAAIEIVNRLFPQKDLLQQASHTLHVGLLQFKQQVLDEVVVSLYKNPRSYTGEDVIEISCHGSPYIQQQIIEACIAEGARPAYPGEFTQRAFLSGKMDLTQAEAVADVIAAQSEAAKQAALKQLRGGFSSDLKFLREQLVNFAALIELELDFSQEDVAFADRTQLASLIDTLKKANSKLLSSFKLGNVIKNGVNVTIAGKPNAGKSTLLNALLNEERAIVSDIAGTTRDTIEEVLNINGILFRFTDTAGIREHTADKIEQIGIQKAYQKIDQSAILLYLADVLTEDPKQVYDTVTNLTIGKNIYPVIVFNKADLITSEEQEKYTSVADDNISVLMLSAKNHAQTNHLEQLKQLLYNVVASEQISAEDTVVTNARHFAALEKIAESLNDISDGMENDVPGDLLALDIRRCLHYLGEITGQVETDRDILGTIFGKFCIGK